MFRGSKRPPQQQSWFFVYGSTASAFGREDRRHVTRVRLTRKLAPILNGIDFSHVHVGDVILVTEAVAAMLIAEGWAELVPEPPPTHSRPPDQRV